MRGSLCYRDEMWVARIATSLALTALSCGYASFRGAIPLTSSPHNLRSIGAFSPQGDRFVLVESRLSERHAETAELRIFRRGPRPDVPAAWTLVRRIRLGDFFATDAAFSPDGRTVALAGWARGGSVALWDVRRGRLTALLPGNAPATQTVAFDASGHFLVSAGIDGRICVWDLRGGRLHVVIQEEASLLRQARFPLVVGGRGRWIAYGRTDGRVAIADLRTGSRIAVRSLGAREVFDLAVSQDGRWLAAATDLGIRLWDTHAPAADARLLSAQRAPSIAFFPDGRTLLASGESPESSRVLDLATGRVAYAIKNGGARASNPALDAASTFAGDPSARRAWSRAVRSLPTDDAAVSLRRLVATYVHFPSIHRVAISPEDLWIAFFDGGRGGLVITERHYRIRTGSRKPNAISPPPASAPSGPLSPAERKRLLESI
jgi:WD40 repeat protein